MSWWGNVQTTDGRACHNLAWRVPCGAEGQTGFSLGPYLLPKTQEPATRALPPPCPVTVCNGNRQTLGVTFAAHHRRRHQHRHSNCQRYRYRTNHHYREHRHRSAERHADSCLETQIARRAAAPWTVLPKRRGTVSSFPFTLSGGDQPLFRSHGSSMAFFTGMDQRSRSRCQ